MDNLIEKRQRQFRASGAVALVAAAGLIICRIMTRLFPADMDDYLSSAIFTVLMQVGFLLVIPFLIYKIALKKSAKEVLEFSNVRKVSGKSVLLSFALGACVIVVTVVVSSCWYVFLTTFGYSSSGSSMPSEFIWWQLIGDIALTGILPAVCEEFTNRGGFLTTMRGSFTSTQTILICALAFGLFHQNIRQVFYTALFGGLMAYLTLETKSIIPSMIVHFTNNTLSVLSDYVEVYAIGSANLSTFIYNHLFLVMILVVAAAVGIVFIARKIARGERARRTSSDESVGSSGAEVPLADKILYRPVTADWTFYIGAIVITAMTTLATFLWGII